jgi:hypothetical protein
MVIAENEAIELQCFFLHRKRILMPSEVTIRESNIAHSRACASSWTHGSRHNNQQKKKQRNFDRASHLCPDGPLAARDERTPAAFRTTQAHPRAFQVHGKPRRHHPWPCLLGVTDKSTAPPSLYMYTPVNMQRIAAHMPFTYVRIVLRESATIELQRLFLHRKRICVLAKSSVCKCKVVHSRACMSSWTIATSSRFDTQQHLQRILTYINMVFWKNAAIWL